MRLPLALLCVALAAPLASAKNATLTHARAAQALLGPGIWSAVIRIENRNPQSVYPRQLHALVFELADILWFYCSLDGTQSLSRHIGVTAAERQNLLPLLQDIEPGFATWALVAPADRARKPGEAPPNACFITSLLAWRDLGATGVDVKAPMLLSFYAETARGRRGHTVLAYEAEGKIHIIDPEPAGGPSTFAVALAAQPLALARALAGNEVDKARMLPLPPPPRTAATNWAGTQPATPAPVQGG